ncbi:MAG: hypothetical protein AAFQ67_09430, partial [Pseudomonadota bacterium]
MPNEAPVLSLNLPAGVFANASARVELINGMPTILSADKDNEIVAATAVPLAVMDSFLSGVSRVVQFRINYGAERTIADAGENTNRSGQLDNRDRALELDERERELEEREQAFADMLAALSGDQASATASGDPAPATRPFAFGDVDENSLSGGDENSGVATDAELSTLMQNLLKTQPNLVIERAARPRLFTVKLTDHTTANSGNSGGLGGQ